MTIETYTYDKDSEESIDLYAEILSWDDESFPIPELLPKMGVVVRDEGKPIVFVCADMSNSIPRAFLDYLQTNQEANGMKRYKASLLAVKFLKQQLKEHGYNVLWAVTPHAGIASLAQRLGFLVNMKPAINLYQEL